MKKVLFLISFIFFYFASFSQIRAFLDTNVIDYANQTVLHIQVKTQKNININFPEFKGDTIADNIEIVQSLPIDTIRKNPYIFEKKYIITSFKDSLRNIKPIDVIIGNDTLQTNNLQLYVIPLQMDSTEIAKLDTTQMIPIFDIKKTYDVKFTFKEFWLRFGRWIVLSLIIIALITLIIWIIYRYKQNKPIRFIQKPSEPAHIIAFKRLKILKEKKLFQNNKIKEFYSELTDILRTYIEHRFEIFALERTSSEIILDFELTNVIDKNELAKLKNLLNISDLAKFAKYFPTIDVCQLNFEQVENFVEATKEKEISDISNIETNNETNQDNKTK